MEDKWIRRFAELANQVRTWSKDPTTQVGAVISSPDRRSIAIGYNGFPPGIADDKRLANRPLKRELTMHAEANAILNCTFDLNGAWLICTHPPCMRCAVMIAATKISGVAYIDVEMDDHWSCLAAENLMREAGIEIRRIPTCPSV